MLAFEAGQRDIVRSRDRMNAFLKRRIEKEAIYL